MINTPNNNPARETLQENHWGRENLWSETFQDNYKPDYDYSQFFNEIEKYFKKDFFSFLIYKKSLKNLKSNEEEYLEVIKLIKENNYKITINFLEKLDNKKKHLISDIFINAIGENKLYRNFNMWKSLLIWMIYWHNYRWNNLIDNEWFKTWIRKIRENFPWFDSKKFMQAYQFIKSNTKRENLNDFFFNIVAEYNLIKNIDWDIESINKENKLNLWENLSLWVFHTNSELWYWLESTYWDYWLDKNWKTTNIHLEWDKPMLWKNWEEILWAYVLDREHESIHKDASWVQYNEYIDSPTWVALFHKGQPIACIWFYISNSNEFFINQIQKVVQYEYDRYGRTIGKHYSNEIKNIDWENILYNIIQELAKKYNISKIIIQWWENNRWINETRKDIETPYFKYYHETIRTIPANKWKKHLSVEIAKKIYDVFALEKWFQYDDNGNLEKNIS